MILECLQCRYWYKIYTQAPLLARTAILTHNCYTIIEYLQARENIGSSVYLIPVHENNSSAYAFEIIFRSQNCPIL